MNSYIHPLSKVYLGLMPLERHERVDRRKENGYY